MTEQTDELRLVNAELEYLANSDGLTKIGNRRRFEKFLADEWSRAVRFKTEMSLVLLDIDLPGPSGLDLARTMKSSATWSSIPLVVVTASVMKHEQDEAQAIGCEYFVAKPFESDRLRAIVAQAARGG